MMRRRMMVRTCLALFALPGLVRGAAAQLMPHDSFTVNSAVLGEARRINVYFPPRYAPKVYLAPDYAAGETRFPVLYLLDGGVQEDWPHVAATVDSAVRAGEMRPVIMIGIENTQRRRDLTGPTEVEADRRIAPRVGNSAAFRRFLGEELMPEVRRRFRAGGEAALMGESLAGLFVVETFLLQPEMFDTYIAYSPSLWWNGEALVRQADALLGTRPELRKSLYLSSADEDNIAPAVARLAELLRTRNPSGLRWEYRPRPDLTHGTIYRAEMPRALRTWLAPVPAAARR